MVVVTGGTGHIGNALVRLLLSRHETVRVVSPPFDDPTSIKDLGADVATGDVRDAGSLSVAFMGAEYVYHLAGIVSIGTGKRKLIRDVNIEGTKNVIEACLKAGVKRLVYVSSIHAFTEPPAGTKIVETKDFDPGKVSGLYAKSKASATAEVLRAFKKGLDVVIVHPTGVIGPYEYRLSNMGQLIVDFISRKLFAYVDGSYDFVDVRDVAEGIVLACEKGTGGENYILSGEQVTVRELLGMLEESTGIRAPKMKIPVWFALLTGPLSEIYYFLRRQPPLYTYYSVSTLRSNSNTTHEKATRELGYTTRPIKKTIEDTVAWIRENRMRQQGLRLG